MKRSLSFKSDLSLLNSHKSSFFTQSVLLFAEYGTSPQTEVHRSKHSLFQKDFVNNQSNTTYNGGTNNSEKFIVELCLRHCESIDADFVL